MLVDKADFLFFTKIFPFYNMFSHFLQHATRPFSGTVPDRNYKEWFTTSDIFQNARETIRDVAVPSPLVEEQEGILTVSMESSIEEMFQLAPSVLGGKGDNLSCSFHARGHLGSSCCCM